MGFHRGNDCVNLVLDITSHRRGLKDPASIFRPSVKVVRMTFESRNLGYALVRVIVPTKEPFVARVREPEIDERIRIAVGCWIIMKVKESSLIDNGPHFGFHQTDFAEQAAGLQSLEDNPVPYHQSDSKMCKSWANS
jgi:hypothetical protein